jgi:hypothetical protein
MQVISTNGQLQSVEEAHGSYTLDEFFSHLRNRD